MLSGKQIIFYFSSVNTDSNDIEIFTFYIKKQHTRVKFIQLINRVYSNVSKFDKLVCIIIFQTYFLQKYESLHIPLLTANTPNNADTCVSLQLQLISLS